jgi:hypothetical protein
MWVNPALAAPPTYGEAPQTNNPPATLNPDNLILSWQEAVKQLEAIKARELELRKAVFNACVSGRNRRHELASTRPRLAVESASELQLQP